MWVYIQFLRFGHPSSNSTTFRYFFLIFSSSLKPFSFSEVQFHNSSAFHIKYKFVNLHLKRYLPLTSPLPNFSHFLLFTILHKLILHLPNISPPLRVLLPYLLTLRHRSFKLYLVTTMGKILVLKIWSSKISQVNLDRRAMH